MPLTPQRRAAAQSLLDQGKSTRVSQSNLTVKFVVFDGLGQAAWGGELDYMYDGALTFPYLLEWHRSESSSTRANQIHGQHRRPQWSGAPVM